MAGQLNLRTVQLGDSADASKNFLISTPAVPDGSFSIQTESGANVLSRTTTGGITLGNAQTWQTVTGTRVIGTTYTNDTPNPIQVRVRVSLPTVAATMVCTVGGVAMLGSWIPTSAAGTETWTIPVGATYVVAYSSGSGGTIAWQELR